MSHEEKRALMPMQSGQCTGCAAPSRREFFERSVAAVIALGLPWDADALRAATLAVEDMQALPGGPAERRYPLPAADGVTIDKDGQVILVRLQGRVFAFNLACPHENTALRWRQKDTRFQCPRHESKYQPDGTFMTGRATRNMDRFAVRRDGDVVLVDVGRLFRSDEQATEWAGAFVAI